MKHCECCPVGGQRGVHRDPNAIAGQREARFFSNTCQKMRGGKQVKVKKRRRQDILRFCADARKLISGSIGTLLDHLSVKMKIDVITIFIHTIHIDQVHCSNPTLQRQK